MRTISVFLLGLFVLSSLSMPTPTRADPPLHSESKLYRAFESFIAEAYLQDWFAEPQRIERHYASRMGNYWGKRGVGVETVQRDKQAYARRWPDRLFRLVSESLLVVPTSQDATYRLQFQFEYDVSGGGRRSSGIGETNLTVTLQNNRVKILSESGRVLRRF